MKRKYFWRVVIILFVLVLAAYFAYPPTPQDLLEYFRSHARNTDTTFNSILSRAQALERERPERAYANLLDAIGTNDIVRYFAHRYPDAPKEKYPNTYILNRLQHDASGRIKLGLDLQGGTSFLIVMDTNRLVELGTNEHSSVTVDTALKQAVEVLRKRVDTLGVSEPVIQPEGRDRILIQLPGLSEDDQAKAKERIQKVALLEFKLVHPESDDLLLHGESAPAYEFKSSPHPYHGQPNGATIPGYLVKKRAEMTGGIRRAQFSRNMTGQPVILFSLDAENTKRFAQITRNNVGHQLAIILDGELQSAPNIKEPIEGGSGEISGSYTEDEASSLVNVLENPLKAPVRIDSQNSVDPTLGKDSIRSGIKASIIGVIAVALFMLVYYQAAGFVANAALMLNIVILLGAMCAIEATFTLPGIAGVVLTIGMAVDANVLIYERIREELAAGKSLRGALGAGYNKAFGTIFDSNLTTVISSVILIFMGTGPVKGFGITLTWGVAISMFTALFVTRVIFDWLLDRNILKGLPMLHLIRGKKIDFMRWAVPAFAASWFLILVGNGYGIFVRGRDVLGVEFAGGETITLNVDQQHKPPVDQIREAAVRVSGGDVLVAYQRDIGASRDTLRVTSRYGKSAGQEEVGEKIFQELKAKFPEARFGGENDAPLSVERVGPTVGQEIQETAVLAALTAMFGILVYVAFRYEFSFAVGAVIAIVHDVFMTLGCYFLFGRELNPTTVAAILTIIGFSINDTIVIFDRIREDLKLGVRGTFREVMNQALNQTLSRTIITSGTVFLATLSLFIFGGGPINDFALTFLVGIVTGTYSSIYIASALVLWWHKGQRPKIGAAQISVQTAAPART